MLHLTKGPVVKRLVTERIEKKTCVIQTHSPSFEANAQPLCYNHCPQLRTYP